MPKQAESFSPVPNNEELSLEGDRISHVRLREQPSEHLDEIDIDRAEAVVAYAENIIKKYTYRTKGIENEKRNHAIWMTLAELRTQEFELTDLQEDLRMRIQDVEENSKISEAIAQVHRIKKEILTAIKQLQDIVNNRMVDPEINDHIEHVFDEQTLPSDAPSDLVPENRETLLYEEAPRWSTPQARTNEQASPTPPEEITETQEGEPIAHTISQVVQARGLKSEEPAHPNKEPIQEAQSATPASEQRPSIDSLEIQEPSQDNIVHEPVLDPHTDKTIIQIPASIEDTRSLITQLHQEANGIEKEVESIDNTHSVDQAAIAHYLETLSSIHDSFEERLRIIQESSKETEEHQEEKALISDGISLIVSLRGKLVSLEHSASLDNANDTERLLEAQKEKKDALEALARDIAAHLRKNGITHPEHSLAQSNGLFKSIGHGIQKLLHPEQTGAIDSKTLRAFQDRIAMIQADYLKNAYSKDVYSKKTYLVDRRIPSQAYKQDRDNDPLSTILGSQDIEKIWKVLHAEIAKLDTKLHQKTTNALLSEQDKNAKALELKRNPYIQSIRHLIPNAIDIIHAVDHDLYSDEIPFSGIDLVKTMAHLRGALLAGSVDEVKTIRTELDEMRSHLAEKGLAIEDVHHLLEEAEAIKKPKRKASSRTRAQQSGTRKAAKPRKKSPAKSKKAA